MGERRCDKRDELQLASQKLVANQPGIVLHLSRWSPRISKNATTFQLHWNARNSHYHDDGGCTWRLSSRCGHKKESKDRPDMFTVFFAMSRDRNRQRLPRRLANELCVKAYYNILCTCRCYYIYCSLILPTRGSVVMSYDSFIRRQNLQIMDY